jgi:hypothetical protein
MTLGIEEVLGNLNYAESRERILGTVLDEDGQRDALLPFKE